MKIIQKQKRGLNQIFQNNKRTTMFFLLGQCLFQGKDREKEKKKKKQNCRMKHNTRH